VKPWNEISSKLVDHKTLLAGASRLQLLGKYMPHSKYSSATNHPRSRSAKKELILRAKLK